MKFNATGYILGRGSNFITFNTEATNYSAGVALTDDDKYAIAVERFVAPAANNEVTANLTLPTTATYGTVAWTSDTPSVISNSGVVNRPAIGQPDVTVKLSYVISVGSNSTQPVEITYVVLAQTAGLPPIDLLISEYIEGTPGLRKAIEIFNGTGSPVVLDNVYTVKLNPNADTTWGTAIALTGTIQPGDVFVLYNDDSTNNAKFGSVGDQESTTLNHNGDDAIGLFKNDVLIDIFGVFGEDLGSGWSLSTLLNGTDTVDKIIVRKNTVLRPKNVWDRSEWEIVSTYVDANAIPTLGSHTVI
jgi:hypothetical protein